MEVGEPQRRKFTAIGTDDNSYSVQMVGAPANGQIAVYDATAQRWIPQSGAITSTIVIEQALQVASLDDQDPPGLGVAQQITFGPPTVTAQFGVDAAGAITCLVTDEYTFRLRLSVGRESNPGEAQLYFRALVNGTPIGYSAAAIIDNQRTEIPITFEGVANMTAGDVLTIEMIRDTDGNNSGGLRAGVPNVSGWNPSPSALVTVTRFAAASGLGALQ